MKQMTIRTKERDEMIDITEEVATYVEEKGIMKGVVYIYCPHTTAGITINENADPDVKADMLMMFDEMYPWNHKRYEHMEGNSAAHLKASTVGSSQAVIIHNGELLLGTWQGIYFCEFDGPRTRKCILKAIEG